MSIQCTWKGAGAATHSSASQGHNIPQGQKRDWALQAEVSPMAHMHHTSTQQNSIRISRSTECKQEEL